MSKRRKLYNTEEASQLILDDGEDVSGSDSDPDPNYDPQESGSEDLEGK